MSAEQKKAISIVVIGVLTLFIPVLMIPLLVIGFVWRSIRKVTAREPEEDSLEARLAALIGIEKQSPPPDPGRHLPQPTSQSLFEDCESFSNFQAYYYPAKERNQEIYPWEMPPERTPWD